MTDIVITNTEGVTSTIQNLPAWATEATQKNIQTLLKGLGTSSSKIEAILRLQLKGFKETTKKTAEGDKEIQKLLKVLDSNDKKEQKQEKAANKAMEDALKELNNLTEDSLTQLGKLGKNTNDQSDNLNKILKDLNNSGDGIMSFANLGGGALGGFAKVVTGVTKLMGALGLAVLGALKYIGSSFVDTFKILNNSLSQGTGGILGLTTNIENVARSANLAGMSLDEFAEFAQANSKILRILGAENFANLYTTTLLTTNGLLQMGMTADDSVESIMTELEYRRRFGLVLNQNSGELQTSLLRSAKELRIFANAVGMSEADLRNESQIREDHTDLMQSQVKAMGGNTMELVNNAQSISRALGSVGGQGLIDPIFEAISKGATGLSSDFITLGQNMPELIGMIEKEAARFDKGAGTLNANLGFDLIRLLRNTTQQQRNQLNNMARAGIEGAADLQNMIRKAQAMSEEAIEAMEKELDPKTMSVLNVFNRLGFVANQVTATLGDFGKTFALEFLGFGRTLDENGKATYDFTEGVKSMTKNIRKFATNVFGYNSPITDSFESLATYIDNMFQPQGADESDEKYKARLKDAREKFVSTISDFAINLARDLKEQIKQGTLFNSIKDFFKQFFDDLTVAINKATGGVLFDNSSHTIMTRRFLNKEISNKEYADYVGTLSGEERMEMSRQLFTGQIEQEANRRGISRQDTIDANYMTGEADEFEKNNRRTKRILNYLRAEISGFDNLSEAERKDLYKQRVDEIKGFNEKVTDYVMKMDKMLTDRGISTITVEGEKRGNFRNNFDYMYKLAGLGILSDIDADNMHLFTSLRSDQSKFGFDSGLGTTTARTVTAQQGVDAIKQQLLGVQNSDVLPDRIGLFSQLGSSTFDNDNSGNSPMVVSNTQQYKDLKDFYENAIKDGRIDHKESDELINAITELNRYIQDDDGADEELMNQIKELIIAQDNLTNEIKADNAS